MYKKTLLTGGRPTGNLHLGHYLGAFKKTVNIHEEYESFFIISNYHMLTTKKTLNDIKNMPTNILGIVAECIAMGMDPKSVNFYIQSNIELMPKLYTFIQNHISVENLIGGETLNEMKSHSSSFSLGLLGYSVMEAADIIGMGADVVPVGVDNVDHLVVTNSIIDSLNNDYSVNMKKPNVIRSIPTNIVGLDFNNKMSKSLDNCIYLKDTKDIIHKKLNNALDDIKGPLFDNFKKSLSIHFEVDHINTYKDLIEFLINIIDPIAIKRKELLDNPNYLLDIIEKGTQIANNKFFENTDSLFKSINLTKNTLFKEPVKIE